MMSTLKYLHNQNVTIISRLDQKSMSVLPAIQEIKSSLSSLPTGTKVIAYTDGSTSSRGNNANSGSGIFITTSNHERLWEGGLILSLS